MKKPTIEIKINNWTKKNWTKRTRMEQNEALICAYELLADISSNYRKSGIADKFTGSSGSK